MRLLSGTVVAGAAVATVLAGATTASAAAKPVVTSQTEGVTASFHPDGDWFRVCDTSLDGWNAYVTFEYVRIDGSVQHGDHFVTSGNGTCRDFSHNFGEGRLVIFRGCVEIAIYPDICGPEKGAVA